MKLNQKGFAISTILYGLLLIISLVVFLLLSLSRFERKSTDNYVEVISKELNKCVNNSTC